MEQCQIANHNKGKKKTTTQKQEHIAHSSSVALEEVAEKIKN